MKDHSTIERPVSQRKRTGPKSPGNRGSTNGCIRVVVADDSPHIRKLMGLIYTIPSGYSVRFAEDGEDAWASLTAEPFDLLITDIDMPRLTGIQLVRRMRNHSFQQPVIFVSGCLPEDADALFQWLAPCDGLEKPFSFKDLLSRSAAMSQYKESTGTNGHSHNGANGHSHNGTNGHCHNGTNGSSHTV